MLYFFKIFGGLNWMVVKCKDVCVYVMMIFVVYVFFIFILKYCGFL